MLPTISPRNASAATLSGVPGLGNPIYVVAPPSMSYTGVQYYRDGAAISGATSSPYTQVAADIPAPGGANIVITALLSGVTTSAVTNIAPAPTPIAPTLTAMPSVSGSVIVGVPLVIVAATFTGTPTPTVVRTIYVGATLVATAAGYTPVVGDVGGVVTVVDTATNSAGSASGTSPGKTVAAAGYPRKVMGLSMPFGDTITGALTSNSSWRTVRTFPKPFKRLRCYLFNMSTSAALVGTKASWSPSESLAGVQRPTIGGATSDASQAPFLFSGSPTVTLPVAGASNIPSITVSDWLATPSIARTDDIGGYPLGYFTQFFTTGAQIGYSNPGTGFGAFLEGLAGMKHKFRLYTQTVDAIANPAAFTITSQTNLCIPMGVEVEYYDGTRTMIAAGDSTLQGTGNTANAGAGLMALSNLDSASAPADSFILAQSGSPAARMYTKLMNILALTTPDIVYFQPFSVNDTSTYGGSAASAKTRAANLVAYCTANSINLILDTPLPIFIAGSAALTGSELTSLTDMSTYLLSLASPTVKVLDLSPLHSSLYSGVYSATYGYDGYHPNPAGHLLRANLLAAAVASFG